VQAAPGHDVGLVPNDPGGRLFDVHQREKPERPLGMVKEEIDIGVFSCLTSRRRAASTRFRAGSAWQLLRCVPSVLSQERAYIAQIVPG
jgi:hypothetical protein